MANTKSSVNVKIDTQVKELASQLLARMGLDQTTAIDMFFRQIIAERKLPFQPVVASTLEERLISSLERTGPNVVELQALPDGNIGVDPDKDSEIYDWAVNG